MARLSLTVLLAAIAAADAFTSPAAFRPRLVVLRMAEETESAFVPPPPAEDNEEEEDEVPLEAVEQLGRGAAKVRFGCDVLVLSLVTD